MAARVSVSCPGCLAKLNLPDESKLGKKIRCPKCSDVFVAKAADDEDLDDLDEDEAPAKSSGGRKRPAAGGRKGPTKKPSGGGANVPLIAGGGVAVVLLIVGGLYLAGVFGGSKPLPVVEQPVPMPAPVAAVAPAPAPAPAPVNPAERILALKWLPKETETLFHLKVADVWQAALLKSVLEGPEVAMGIAEMQRSTGLTPTDIESVTFGASDAKGMQSLGNPMMMMAAAQNPPKSLAVIRLTKSITLEDILKAAPTLKTSDHGSKKYFEGPGAVPNAQQFGGWVAEPKTIVMGSIDELKAAMDRGETVVPRKELLFMDPNPHLVLIVAPRDPKSMTQQIPPMPPSPGTPAEFEAMSNAFRDSFQAFGLGLSIRGGFDLQTSLMMADSDSAGKVKAGIDAGIVMGKQQLEALKGMPFSGIGEALMTNLKVDSQSQVVKISTGLPDSSQQEILNLAMMASSFMGLPGLGGPPGSPVGNSPGLSPGGTLPEGPPMSPMDSHWGETEPVAAQSATGLKDPATLTARTAFAASPSAPDVPSLRLILEVPSASLDNVCAFGDISLKPIPIDGGNLRLDMKSFMSNSIVDNFQYFESSDIPMRLDIPLESPKSAASGLKQIEGSFKLLTFEESSDFTLENVPKAAKRPLADPDLKAAGIRLVIKPKDGGETMSLSYGKGFFVGAAKVLFAGDPAPLSPKNNLTYVTLKGQTGLNMDSGPLTGPKFPEDLQLEFKVYRGVKEQTVNFQFKDVSLPSPDAKRPQ